MKYIIFTFDGRGFPIAWHLKRENQEVTLCIIEDPKEIFLSSEKYTENEVLRERRIRIGEGIVNRIPWSKLSRVLPSLNKEEYFLFFDDNALFPIAEKVASLGFKGNYPTKWDREMEIDREKAKEFVKKHYKDVRVAEFHEFKKIQEAEKFLKETDKIWVLKGYNAEADTVVPTSHNVELAKEEILTALEKDKQKYESEGFLLEEKIIDPIEITPQSVWYDGELIYTNVDIEYKKIGAGEVGYTVGCAGDLVVNTPLNCLLNKIAFPPIVEELAKEHKGLFIWDISLLIDKRNNVFYFGEYCPSRIGINAFFTELTLLDTVSEYFEKIVNKQNPYQEVFNKLGVSVTIFNLHKEKDKNIAKENLKISFPSTIEPYVWLDDVYAKDKVWLTTGTSEQIGAITGKGNSYAEAVHDAFYHISNLSLEDMYYRYQTDYFDTYPTSILQRYLYCQSTNLLEEGVDNFS